MSGLNRCGRCGERGHNRRSCPEPSAWTPQIDRRAGLLVAAAEFRGRAAELQAEAAEALAHAEAIERRVAEHYPAKDETPRSDARGAHPAVVATTS